MVGHAPAHIDSKKGRQGEDIKNDSSTSMISKTYRRTPVAMVRASMNSLKVVNFILALNFIGTTKDNELGVGFDINSILNVRLLLWRQNKSTTEAFLIFA